MAILVVGPAWVGDMVMAHSLFQALRQRQPQVQIDVLAPAWSLPLLTHMPEVRKGICSPFGHGQLGLRVRWALGKSLRGRYEQAAVLQNAWKSALVPWAARIPQRTGWLGEARWGLLNDVRHLNTQRLPQMVQRFVALAQSAGIAEAPVVSPPRLRVTEDAVQSALQQRQLTASVPILALCPGAAYGPAKRWPAVSYAALAQRWQRQGGVVWLFGSVQDQTVCTEIQQQCSAACTDLSGRLSLSETVALLSVATVVVSNDSGLMHVAAALNRPVVALYGSTSPAFAPPLTQCRRTFYLDLDCSPCRKRECPLGHLACLQQITVAQVWDAVQDLAAECDAICGGYQYAKSGVSGTW
ncbi:MAG: lipopolysaccharide heptosyltransferase II [Pseudomonadota bacterium]